MKIVFIENMYRTYFWERIAERLQKMNHDVGLIVQNHVYKPQTNAAVYTIPYPSRKDKHVASERFSYLRSTDRIINFFDGKDAHYEYYYDQFNKAIDDLAPDLVIGESTLFHEIMIIDICKTKNIPYLHPSSTSYPSGRFSFYCDDTKIPFAGEKVSFDKEKYDLLIDDIDNRKIVPDYMKKPLIVSNQNSYPKHKSLRDKSLRLLAYYSGEKYNTPAPLKKIFKDKEVSALLRRWDTLSTSLSIIELNQKIILYPLQLQPEANLDVWGNKHRDQVRLVQEMADVIPKDWVIVVKTNPKSKYEMSHKLLELVQTRHNIVALARNVPMADIFKKADIVVTVTGTIAIECVLSGKPLGLLGTSIVEGSAGSIQLNHPNDVVKLIDILQKEDFAPADQEEKQELIHKMMITSYPGIVSDPVSNPGSITDDNLQLVTDAFQDIFDKFKKS